MRAHASLWCVCELAFLNCHALCAGGHAYAIVLPGADQPLRVSFAPVNDGTTDDSMTPNLQDRSHAEPWAPRRPGVSAYNLKTLFSRLIFVITNFRLKFM